MMQWSMHMTKSTQNTIATYMSDSQPKYLIRNTCIQDLRELRQEYYFSMIIYNSIIKAPYKQFCDYCCIVIFFRYHTDLLNYRIAQFIDGGKY